MAARPNRLQRNEGWSETPAAATETAMAAAAAATTASAAAEATATASATTRFLGSGFVHDQVAAIDVLAVERGNGSLGLFFRAHLDKCEALGAARVTVRDDLRRINRAVRSEHLFEVVLVDVEGQIADIKLFAQGDSPEVRKDDTFQLDSRLGAIYRPSVQEIYTRKLELPRSGSDADGFL